MPAPHRWCLNAARMCSGLGPPVPPQWLTAVLETWARQHAAGILAVIVFTGIVALSRVLPGEES